MTMTFLLLLVDFVLPVANWVLINCGLLPLPLIGDAGVSLLRRSPGTLLIEHPEGSKEEGRRTGRQKEQLVKRRSLRIVAISGRGAFPRSSACKKKKNLLLSLSYFLCFPFLKSLTFPCSIPPSLPLSDPTTPIPEKPKK